MTKQEAIEKGAKYYCPGCGTAYTYIPKYWDDRASCEGAYFTQCKHCDCDIILHLEDDSIVRV
jgi:hypothetical protein